VDPGLRANGSLAPKSRVGFYPVLADGWVRVLTSRT